MSVWKAVVARETWSQCACCCFCRPGRPSATEQRCGEVESAAFDVFAHLGATEEQLDFPVLYASAREASKQWQGGAPQNGE